MPAPFPKVLGDGFLGRAATAVNQLLIRVSKSLFSYQIFVVAEATPDVDFILEDARRRGEVHHRAAIADTTTRRRSRCRKSARRVVLQHGGQRTTISIAPDAGSADDVAQLDGAPWQVGLATPVQPTQDRQRVRKPLPHVHVGLHVAVGAYLASARATCCWFASVGP